MARMAPAERRDAIVEAALAVMLRKGMAATTVRDVADEMGTSSGLIHHYFASMDDLLAAAFDRAASQDLRAPGRRWRQVSTRVERLRDLLRHLHPGRAGLGVPAVARRVGGGGAAAGAAGDVAAAQRGLAAAAGGGHPRRGRRQGLMSCADPDGAAWRILSLAGRAGPADRRAPGAVDREAVIAWSVAHAEPELGLERGALRLSVTALRSGCWPP